MRETGEAELRAPEERGVEPQNPLNLLDLFPPSSTAALKA